MVLAIRIRRTIRWCCVDVPADVAGASRHARVVARQRRTAALKKLMRIAYYVAMEDMPYTSYAKLRQLHADNGVSELCPRTGALCNPSANYDSTLTVKDMHEAMALVCSARVTKEIHGSPTSSLLVDESTGEDGHAHLLIYLQCIKDGTTTVEFLGEITMTLDTAALTDWVGAKFSQHLPLCEKVPPLFV